MTPSWKQSLEGASLTVHGFVFTAWNDTDGTLWWASKDTGEWWLSTVPNMDGKGRTPVTVVYGGDRDGESITVVEVPDAENDGVYLRQMAVILEMALCAVTLDNGEW